MDPAILNNSESSVEFAQKTYADAEFQRVHINLFSQSTINPLPTVLPPNLSQADFDAAIAEWTKIVGKDGVFGQKSIREYIDPYELNESSTQRKLPSGALCPGSVEEIQGILKIANNYKIPLWTFSRGKNLGYGGPAPRLNGSVALDLHRMDKIIEVNEEFSYAVVEPGVTFGDLYKHCKDNKLRVWPSVPSLAWGSVVGNASILSSDLNDRLIFQQTLDRGTGFTPTATHHQNIAGLEIVLADGDIVRTGQFGITNSASAHISKFSFGPSIEGLFLQSNLGVVTKMGIWLTPQPEAYMSCFFQMPEIDDIAAMTEALGSLRQKGIIPNTIFVSNIIEVLSMIKQRKEFYDGPGPIPDPILRSLQKEYGLGYWNAKFGLFGPRGILQAQIDEVQKLLTELCPSGTLRYEMFSGSGKELLDASNIPDPHGGVFVGVPTLWSLPMIKWRMPKDESRGVAGHGDFSSIIPSNGQAVLSWVRESKRICESHGFDLFCDYFMHERHLIFVNFQAFDKSLVAHQTGIQAIFADMYKIAKLKGFSNYRSHVNHMDPIAELYDFNSHAYRRFVDKLKDSLDPNGVLSPGKQGIWGTKYDSHRDIFSFSNSIPRL